MNLRRLLWCSAALAALLVLVSAAPAQEVRWRYDYNAARKEALEKGLPLLIDFGTVNCYYCKKLDEDTFSVGSVSSVMNEKFIPLKIDANRDAPLAEALHIDRFPTIVMAQADGKILATHVGFMEAPQFLDKMQRAIASAAPVAAPEKTVASASPAPSAPAPAPAPPAEPPAMTRDFELVRKAIAASDYPRAIVLLRGLTEDNGQWPTQRQARVLLKDIEQQAAGRLAHARQMVDKGQATEAMATAAELVRVYPGTQAAVEGGRMLTAMASAPDSKLDQRARRARELLALAREDYRTQDYLCSLNRCNLLITSFSDLPEGVEASQLAGEIKNNPEWMRSACDQLSEQLGVMYLSLAETWLQKGQPKQAEIYLERVVQSFPNSRQAEQAQVRLAQIQGQPTRTVNFKQP